MFAVLWFHDVQDNGHTVFIVIPYQALIRIGCVRTNYSIPLIATLGWLVVRNDNTSAWG